MFNPTDTSYEAEIAALSAKVHAAVRFLTRDPDAIADAVQQAFLAFAEHRHRVVDYAVAEAGGDRAHTSACVCAWICTAAERALARAERKQRRLVTGSDQPIERECPPDLGAALDRAAAHEMVRQEIELVDATTKVIIEGMMHDRPHVEIAAELGLRTENASMIRRTRAKAQLHRSTRLADAYRSWQAASSASYSGGDRPQSEPIRVAFAAAAGRSRRLSLEVADLQWHPDGYLRGSFVAPADAGLPDETAALAMLRGAPGDEDAYVAAEPFVLSWSEGPAGRTAAFSTYLGPRVWVRPWPMVLPADAVQFVFTG